MRGGIPPGTASPGLDRARTPAPRRLARHLGARVVPAGIGHRRAVLQEIEDLEPVRRGIYCGAVGFVDGDRDRAELAVAIRTFTIAGSHTYLGVGGGIVADSEARAEWDETELKAARLLHAAGAQSVEPAVVS